MGSAVKPPPPPPPPRLHFHKESFPSTESCLPDSLLCFLLPLPSPRAHPHPVLLVCNGAWRQMRSFDIQTEIQEDRAQIKKKTSAFLSLGLFADAISLRGSRWYTHSRVRAHKHAAFSPPVPLLSDLIFFFFFPGSRL